MGDRFELTRLANHPTTDPVGTEVALLGAEEASSVGAEAGDVGSLEVSATLVAEALDMMVALLQGAGTHLSSLFTSVGGGDRGYGGSRFESRSGGYGGSRDYSR